MKNTINKVYLLLGGNLQNVEKTFIDTRNEINISVGKIINQSKEYKSEAWGFKSDNYFLNQVLEIETSHTPLETLHHIQVIEKKLGRIRTSDVDGFESRVIDIDILYFNSDIIKSDQLTVPHYALHERNFTLSPLVEISPLYIHPIFRKTNKELLDICTDTNIATIK